LPLQPARDHPGLAFGFKPAGIIRQVKAASPEKRNNWYGKKLLSCYIMPV
jgi:hypothetical protein